MKHPGSLSWLPAALAASFISCVSPPDNRGPASPGDQPGNETAALAIAAPPDRLVPVTTLPVQQTSFAGLAMAPVTAAAMRYPAGALLAESAPLSLTASDGTGLRLVSLDARAVIDGPLAFTELQLSFANPLDRVIEGRFSITLPEGAAISRLAMRLDTGWQEAEVVELQAARRAYEDFLHRRQDPALLEKEAGNEFNARIFPIPARGTKDIIISYSQNLPQTGAAYRLPLRGLPAIDSLRVSALVGQRKGNALAYQPVSMQQSAYKPDRDFEVAVPAEVAGLRNGQIVAARVRPSVRTADQRLERLVVLFDTSASRAPGFAASVAQLGQVVAALAQAHGNVALTVAAFDQAITPIYEGTAAGFGKGELDTILARRPLGASDLHAALTWAGERGGRVVLFTDAIATVGPNEGDALRASVHALREKVQRLDVILAGGIKDRALAERMARGTLSHDGVVLDAEQPVAELAKRLGQSTVSNVKVEIAGAEWVWPRTLDGVQPGDEVLVFAELGAKNALAPGKPLAITLTGPVGENGAQKLSVPLAEVARPLIERAAAQANIEMLTAQRDTLDTAPDAATKREQLRKQIIEVSTRSRVLSDYTALLVLETEADYVRFGIDRKSLADILTVGPRGLELLQRGKPVLLMATGEPASKPKGGKNDTSNNLRDRADRDDDTGAPADEADGEAEKKAEMAPAAEMEESAHGGPQGVEGGVVGGVVGGVLPGNAAPASPVASASSGEGRGGGGRSERRQSSAAAPAAEPPPPPTSRPSPRRPTMAEPQSEIAADVDSRAADKVQGTSPFTGKLAEVMQLLASKRIEQALTLAVSWQNDEPGDVVALIALGEALEAAGRHALAARAYGSLIDLFPGRADMRRMAGERLERLAEHGNALATDAYAKAVAQRPDHLTGHRLLAYALVRQGKYAQAFDAAMAGLAREYPDGRFEGGKRILREDLGIIAAAWLRHEPGARSTVESRLASAGAMLATEPSLRFVLTWETDANDVDFHIHDGKGGHAFYSQRQLLSGGELYADVTTGYGPECFAIPGPGRAFPYQLQIHYYSRGPMGYGMGKLEILDHDGQGNLRFEQRPFVVMNDGAYVDLGTVGGQALAR
jgi:Vault protein inter-alpha-trypsin domain